MAGRGLTRRLYAVDVLSVACATALGIGVLVSGPGNAESREIWMVCAAVACLVPLLAWVRAHLDIGVMRVLHDWSFAAIAYPMYLAVLMTTSAIHGDRLWDPSLIAIDRWLFGTDPTVWLQRFAVPALTEVLQIAYALFYVMFLAVGAELYAEVDRGRFRRWAFLLAFGFYLFYAGYLLVPAVGPRFTLHDIAALDRELPGLWLTGLVRGMVNEGGLVQAGQAGADALRHAPRDAFPSGHTMMTVVAIIFSWRLRLRTRWLVIPVGTLLILATVYLRYHYVVDLLAGTLLAGVCLSAGPALHRWITTRLGTLDETDM